MRHPDAVAEALLTVYREKVLPTAKTREDVFVHHKDFCDEIDHFRATMPSEAWDAMGDDVHAIIATLSMEPDVRQLIDAKLEPYVEALIKSSAQEAMFQVAIVDGLAPANMRDLSADELKTWVAENAPPLT